MPNSDISKSLALYENSILDRKIEDIKKEIKKQEELSIINKIRKTDDIDKRINDIKDYFKKCSNDLEKNDFKIQLEKYKAIEKSYQDIIKSQNEKEKAERAKFKTKEMKNFNRQDKAKPLDNPKKHEDLKINLKNILEYLNENLHNNKNLALKESHELKNKISQTEKEKKKFNDYMLICNDVLSKANTIINNKPAEFIIKDLREIDMELAKITDNIESNSLQQCSKEDTNIKSYRNLLSKAFENTAKLINDLQDLQFDSNLESAVQSKKILKGSIINSKQNNILLDKILTISNALYTKCCMKELITMKPDSIAIKRAHEAREEHWKNSQNEKKRQDEENIKNEAEGFTQTTYMNNTFNK